MHSVQKALLDLSEQKNLEVMTLREIGELIGIKHPQVIKHHLEQLKKKGLLKAKREGSVIEMFNNGKDSELELINIPIYGGANCGPATLFAEERLEGYLKLSPLVLKAKPKKNIFALKASGYSMNKADINGDNIEDGDYIIIDPSETQPTNGSYVLTIIDGMANIKKFIDKSDRNIYMLVSESTENFPPIYLTPKDNFVVNGKVIQVVKSE